jgi:hypothetical protein
LISEFLAVLSGALNNFRASGASLIDLRVSGTTYVPMYHID